MCDAGKYPWSANPKLLEIISQKEKVSWPVILARGATVRSSFELNEGDVLKISLGRSGNKPQGGSGGTFIFHVDRNQMLAVAGGAGGVIDYRIADDANASFSKLGNWSDVLSDTQDVGSGGENHTTSSGGSGIARGPAAVEDADGIEYIVPKSYTAGLDGGICGGPQTDRRGNSGGFGGGGFGMFPAPDDSLLTYGCGGGGGYTGGHGGKLYGGGGGSYSKDPNAVFEYQRKFSAKIARSFAQARCIITGPN